MTLSSLISRVEEGEGADRELEALISVTLDGRTVRESGNMILARNSRPPHDEYVLGWIDPGKTRRNFTLEDGPDIPRYTTSLDAVVSLIEKKLPGWAYTLESNPNGMRRAVMWRHGPNFRSDGSSLARALLAAALKALRALESSKAGLADANSIPDPKSEDMG